MDKKKIEQLAELLMELTLDEWDAVCFHVNLSFDEEKRKIQLTDKKELIKDLRDSIN